MGETERPAWHATAAAIKAGEHDFTPGEVKLLEWQLGHTGSFYTALFDLISKADHLNQATMRRAFPSEVDAFISWSEGDLARRFRDMGLEV